MLVKSGFYTPSVLRFFNHSSFFIYLFYVSYLFNTFLFNLNISLINEEDIRMTQNVTSLA